MKENCKLYLSPRGRGGGGGEGGQEVNLTGNVECLYMLSYSPSIHSKAVKVIIKEI